MSRIMQSMLHIAVDPFRWSEENVKIMPKSCSSSCWEASVVGWTLRMHRQEPQQKSAAVNIKCRTLSPAPQSALTLAGQWTNVTKINKTRFWLCYLGERGRRYSRNRGTLSGPSLRLNPPLSVRSRSYAGRGPPRPMLYRTGPSRNSRCGGSDMKRKIDRVLVRVI